MWSAARITPPARTLTPPCWKRCKEHDIDLVVLAGFLSVLGPSVIAAYPRRILNVHPALIPSFCGPGMYGLRPHEAALARGCKVTGATVHFVNEECDGGPILLQKAVDILPGDTPEVLQKRVMEQAEWKLLPQGCGYGLQRRDSIKLAERCSASPLGRGWHRSCEERAGTLPSQEVACGCQLPQRGSQESLLIKENNNGERST